MDEIKSKDLTTPIRMSDQLRGNKNIKEFVEKIWIFEERKLIDSSVWKKSEIEI